MSTRKTQNYRMSLMLHAVVSVYLTNKAMSSTHRHWMISF